jgi:hypothetical protein
MWRNSCPAFSPAAVFVAANGARDHDLDDGGRPECLVGRDDVGRPSPRSEISNFGSAAVRRISANGRSPSLQMKCEWPSTTI